MNSTLTATQSEYRIYVACLAAYNNGKLHGVWIDIEGKDADDIQAEIDKMLESSPEPDAEEWRIDDTEGMEGFHAEDMSLDELVELVEVLEENSDAFKVYYGHLAYSNDSISESIEKCNDSYRGTYDTINDFVEDYLEEMGIIDQLQAINVFTYATADSFLDIDKIANDMECSGDYNFIEYEGSVYVFSCY